MQRASELTFEDLKNRTNLVREKLKTFYENLIQITSSNQGLEASTLETIKRLQARVNILPDVKQDYNTLKIYFTEIQLDFLDLLEKKLTTAKEKLALKTLKASPLYIELDLILPRLNTEFSAYGSKIHNQEVNDFRERKLEPEVNKIAEALEHSLDQVSQKQLPKTTDEIADYQEIEKLLNTIREIEDEFALSNEQAAKELDDDDILNYKKESPPVAIPAAAKKDVGDTIRERLVSGVLQLDSSLKSPKYIKLWDEIRNDVFSHLKLEDQAEASMLRRVSNIESPRIKQLIIKTTDLFVQLENEKQNLIDSVTNGKEERKIAPEVRKIVLKQSNLNDRLRPLLESIYIKLNYTKEQNAPISWVSIKENFLKMREETKQSTPEVLGGFFKHRARDIYDEVEKYLDQQAEKEINEQRRLGQSNRRGV